MRMRDIESIKAVLVRTVEDYEAKTYAMEGEKPSVAAEPSPLWALH